MTIETIDNCLSIVARVVDEEVKGYIVTKPSGASSEIPIVKTHGWVGGKNKRLDRDAITEVVKEDEVIVSFKQEIFCEDEKNPCFRVYTTASA